MASLITVVAVALVIAAAALWFKRRRVSSCLLMTFPATLCIMALVDLSGGAARIGQAAFESDLKQLAYVFCLLLLCLLAALRPSWGWLFWAAWAFSALVCGVLVYLAFFWKVFS